MSGMDHRRAAMVGGASKPEGPLNPPSADNKEPLQDLQHFSSPQPEGTLHLKSRLQAKRTKKPPKNLENYVCRPAIRTSSKQTRRSRKMTEESGEEDSSRVSKKSAEKPSSDGLKAERLHLRSEEVPATKNSSPLHSQVAEHSKASSPPGLVSNKDPDSKDRVPVNGTATSVTEKLAQLIATCPPSKSSKIRAKKQASSAAAPVSSPLEERAMPKDDSPAAAEHLSSPSKSRGSEERMSSQSSERGNLRQAKDSILEKFCIRKEGSTGEREKFNNRTSIPVVKSSPSEKGVPDTEMQEKLCPVYCTSLDYRKGGASDASAAVSPFSAVGEGNLPSPAPATSLTSSSRSSNVNCPQSPSSSLHLTPDATRVECIHEPSDKSKFTSDTLPNNRAHRIPQNSIDFLPNEKTSKEVKSVPSGNLRTSVPPVADKKPTQRVEPGSHRSDPSVVSFASLLRKKQLVKVGSLSEKPPYGSQHGGANSQTKHFKKRKGKKPRWTKVPNKTTQKVSPEHGVVRPASVGSDRSQRGSPAGKSSVYGQVPKLLSKANLSNEGAINETHKLYSSHRNYRMVCMSPGGSDAYKPKRGKPKSKDMPHLEGPPRRAQLKIPAFKVASPQSKEDQGPPVLQPEIEMSSMKTNLPRPAFPRKRGRPRRDSSVPTRTPPVLSVAPFLVTDNRKQSDCEKEKQQNDEHLNSRLHADDANGSEADKKSLKKNNGQLVKNIIRKINKMKTMKRKKLLSQILSGTASGTAEQSSRGKTPAKLQGTVSTLAATFTSKLGQQINVSKKGTIYMGKRRGRKPKSMADTTNPVCSPTLENPDHHEAHSTLPHFVAPVISPNISSPEVLPSPASSLSPGASGAHSPIGSDASFVEPSPVPYLQPHSRQGTFLQTLAMRKASKDCRQLSPPTLLPNSPSHLHEIPSLKEATSSPISESHSDETVPSDSGIGTDNNSTSDRAEKFCAQKKRRHSFEHVSLLVPQTSPVLKEKHKHKCKHRSHDFLAYDKLKRPKRKRKKKYPQLRARQDPDFLAEVEELITRLSDIHLSHRSHHFIPRDLLPTIFRLNFNSFYSHPTFPLDPLHYIRKPDLKKKRGRPPKMRDSMSEMPFVHSLGFPLSSTGFYPSYSMPYTPSPITAAPIGLSYYGRYPPTL